jgi:hypothetical protein
MSRRRILIVSVLCLGAAVALVRLAPAIAASWQSRRQALQVDSVRVIADSQAIRLLRRSRHRDTDSTISAAGLFPLVEVTLRNPAPSISFLTTLDFEVTTRQRRDKTACAGRPLPWEYDLLLDGRGAAERHVLTLSQLVDPESRHRFVIALGQSDPPAHGEYEVELTLHYNEGGTLPLGRVVLAIDGPACGIAPRGGPTLPRWVERARLRKT